MGRLRERLRRLEESAAHAGDKNLFWEAVFSLDGGAISRDIHGNEPLSDKEIDDIRKACGGRLFVVNFVSQRESTERTDFIEPQSSFASSAP